MTKQNRTKTTGAAFNAYDAITNQIIAKLEAGVVPWRKQYRTNPHALGTSPRNATSGRAYRGLNHWLLVGQDFSDPRWLTFKDAKSLGGSVRKGEKGTQICFWKPSVYKKTNDDGEVETKKGLILRVYTVFNVEQCDGLTFPERKTATAPVNPHVEAQRIVDEMPKRPEIRYGNDAYYSPSRDFVEVPSPGDFKNWDSHFHTLFHELTHSTMHASRLDRQATEGAGKQCFGSASYGREELVAEMGAAYLGGECGINPRTIDNSAAYIASWLTTIKADKQAIFYAASRAQAAADYILNRAA